MRERQTITRKILGEQGESTQPTPTAPCTAFKGDVMKLRDSAYCSGSWYTWRLVYEAKVNQMKSKRAATARTSSPNTCQASFRSARCSSSVRHWRTACARNRVKSSARRVSSVSLKNEGQPTESQLLQSFFLQRCVSTVYACRCRQVLRMQHVTAVQLAKLLLGLLRHLFVGRGDLCQSGISVQLQSKSDGTGAVQRTPKMRR